MTNRYLRPIRHRGGKVDIYAVLLAFGVTCPACQHAAKKILCAGQRVHKSRKTDLLEAMAALRRAIELEGDR